MGKVFKNETQITIPEDTLVLICGSQNSGKTSFTTKHFDAKYVISTDELFEEILRTQATNSDTRITLLKKTTKLFEERVEQHSKENSITVVDAAPFEFKHRIEMIRVFRKLHTNIVLIVLDVSYPTLKSRPKKTVTKKKKQYGIVPISDEELLLNWLLISEQIENEQIGYKANKTYIISERFIEKCEVKFE